MKEELIILFLTHTLSEWLAISSVNHPLKNPKFSHIFKLRRYSITEKKENESFPKQFFRITITEKKHFVIVNGTALIAPICRQVIVLRYLFVDSIAYILIEIIPGR